jgi:hypothetical protein
MTTVFRLESIASGTLSAPRALIACLNFLHENSFELRGILSSLRFFG